MQSVTAGRVAAVATTLIALLAFAVAIIIVHDRARVVISSVLGCLIFSGLTIVLLPRMAREAPPPLRIEPNELPPKASLPTAMLPGLALYAIGDAGILAWSFYSQTSSSLSTGLGIVLGGPIIVWWSLRNSKRIERELGGTLWTTPNFAWTARSRRRYLVE